MCCFDAYSTEEEALKSFGCIVGRQGSKKSPWSPVALLLARFGGPKMRVWQVEGVTVLDVRGKLRGELSRGLCKRMKELGVKVKFILSQAVIEAMDRAKLM